MVTALLRLCRSREDRCEFKASLSYTAGSAVGQQGFRVKSCFEIKQKKEEGPTKAVRAELERGRGWANWLRAGQLP